jgi:hypothetical protein
MQQREHLRYKRDINKRAETRDQRLPGLTRGGISATEPSMSQTTPLRKKKKIRLKLKELRPTPHLFPEEAGQTKLNTVATPHDEQTGEHDQKQDHVENYCWDESNYAGIGDGLTGEVCRDPNRAILWMG